MSWVIRKNVGRDIYFLGDALMNEMTHISKICWVKDISKAYEFATKSDAETTISEYYLNYRKIQVQEKSNIYANG